MPAEPATVLPLAGGAASHSAGWLIAAAGLPQALALAWLHPGSGSSLPWPMACLLFGASVLMGLAAWQLQRRAAAASAVALASAEERLADAQRNSAAAKDRLHARNVKHQRSIDRLSLVAEHALALTLISDRYDRVVWANEAFCSAMGWPLAQLQGQDAEQVLSGSGLPCGSDPRARAGAADPQAAFGSATELRVQSRDGRELWLAIELRPLPRAGGQGGGFVRVCIDHSARMHQQAKLRALWAALPVGVLVHDTHGRIVDANPVAERLLGESAPDLAQRDPADPRWQALTIDGEPLGSDQHPVGHTLATASAAPAVTLAVQTPAGDHHWLRWRTEAQTDPEGRLLGVVSCFVDITEQQRLLARLEALDQNGIRAGSDSVKGDSAATADGATGPVESTGPSARPGLEMPTRAWMFGRIDRALSHLRRHPGYCFAVVCVQIAMPNEAPPGHPDRLAVLRLTAARLRQLLRPGDTLACGAEDEELAARSGGDAFALMLDGVGDAVAMRAIAERLLLELAAPWTAGDAPTMDSAAIELDVSDRGTTLNVHVGAAICRSAAPVLTAADVLRQADLALHDAQQAGALQWRLHDDSSAARVVRQQALLSELQRAREDGELMLVYQPILSLQASAAVSAVEALLCWQHPQRGLLPALDFIDAAESGGLLDAMGEGLLRQACTQFMRWQRELGTAAPAQLAVNLSARQLSREGLSASIASILSATGMSAAQLQIEVGDAALAEVAALDLEPLRDAGLQLVLDDFGRDGETLARLQKIPVDGVKIDRSFVHRSISNESQQVLVEAIVNLARRRGLQVTAEGIESAEEARLMAALGCDAGQGHLWCRPLTAPAFSAWVQDRSGIAPVHASATDRARRSGGLYDDGDESADVRRRSEPEAADTV